MALAGIDIDITWVTSFLSAGFALSVALEAYYVYRRTGRAHLQAYSAAFTLIAISYALLIPLAFGMKLPTIGYETGDILTYPPRIVISTIGFAILALSYSETQKVKQILYGLIALLVLLVALVILPQVPSIPYSADIILFLVQVGLLLYVFFRMWQVTRSIGLVSLSFIILLASQLVAAVASLRLEEATVLFSQSLGVVSFGLLFFALALTIRHKPRAHTSSGDMQ